MSVCGDGGRSCGSHVLADTACSSAVAVQCLETAFDVSTDDQSLAVPMTLPEIFSSATGQVCRPRAELCGFSFPPHLTVCVPQFPAQTETTHSSPPAAISEEQRAEAEQLKTDGQAISHRI